jgi:hypothetical protein
MRVYSATQTRPLFRDGHRLVSSAVLAEGKDLPQLWALGSAVGNGHWIDDVRRGRFRRGSS